MRTAGKSAVSYSFPECAERSKTRKLLLDEVNRLQNPSEILKISADHYPSVRILAIGSSSLEASARFRDTLAGRKQELWLTPMITEDLGYFNAPSPEHRLVRGGLPPFFMAKSIAEREYQEWLDAYWAKDILQLFRLERRFSFMRFAELLFAQSGGRFEASRFSTPCEVSRTTISNYKGWTAPQEVDFVLKHPAKHLTAVEAKWSASAFDPSGLNAFRRTYPEGRNFVVCQDVRRKYARRFRTVLVEFVSLGGLLEELKSHRPARGGRVSTNQ